MKTIATGFAAFVLFCCCPAWLWAQSTEEMMAQSSERDGKLREALNQYVAALQKTSNGSIDDLRIREAIIRVAQRMSPRPAVPEEARNRMIRGRAAFKLAKSPADMKDAIDEFRHAVNSAPWLGEAYFNLALVFEKAENYPEAIRNYKLYLLAEPSQKESASVRDKLVELEYLQERTRKDVAKRKEEERKGREEHARASDIGRLTGDWCGDMVGGNLRCGNEYKTRISGTTIEFSMYPVHNRWVVIFRGEVRGNKIEGVNITYDDEGRSDCSATTPMTGTVINDNRIELDYDAVSVYSLRNTCKMHERRPARKVFIRRPTG